MAKKWEIIKPCDKKKPSLAVTLEYYMHFVFNWNRNEIYSKILFLIFSKFAVSRYEIYLISKEKRRANMAGSSDHHLEGIILEKHNN